MLKPLLTQANAVVLHQKNEIAVLPAGADADPSDARLPFQSVDQRVFHQRLDQELGDALLFKRLVQLHLDLKPFGVAPLLNIDVCAHHIHFRAHADHVVAVIEDAAQELSEVDRHLHHDIVFPKPGAPSDQVKHIIDEMRIDLKRERLRFCDAEALLLLLNVPHQLFDLLRHKVEIRLKLAHFIAALHRHARIQLAVSEFLHRRTQLMHRPADRLRNAPRNQHADERCRRQSQQQCAEQAAAEIQDLHFRQLDQNQPPQQAYAPPQSVPLRLPLHACSVLFPFGSFPRPSASAPAEL